MINSPAAVSSRAHQPRVSITIASYNHARFLPAAIESALTQTHRNLEIVVVDDGSTDGSLAIAQDYAARRPDVVRVFTHAGHRNRGISATVNLGFEKGTGVYWAGLPSDDLLHPLKVAEQVAFLERHPDVGWVYGYAYHVDEHGRLRADLGLFGEDITDAGDPVERLIGGNVIPGMTVLMRRAAVAEIAPHDEALVYSDWDFWVRLAIRHRPAFVPRARVFYRVHGGNTAGTSDHLRFGRSLDVLLKLRRQADGIGGALARPRTQALLDLEIAHVCYRAGDEAQAHRHLATALLTDPTLRADARYFARWLRAACHRRPSSDPSVSITFGPWVLARLPRDVDGRFRDAARRAVDAASRQTAGPYALARRHWRSRRRVLGAIVHDSHAWRDRTLLRAYLAILAGARVDRQLRRVGGLWSRMNGR
jgi:GT2 family glycosyltransferase